MSNLFDNPRFDIMIATISWRQMHKTIIFCLNFARQLQTNNEQTCTQNGPTCWQLAGEVDPHGPSCSDSRVAWDSDSPWITGPMTAHQSVAYVRHIILVPAANLCTLSAIVFLPLRAWIWRHIPIPRRQCHFVDCQRTRMTMLTKDFAMRHDENYVKWNGISIKWYQFVTNCPYHQTIYSKHNICSYDFLLRFHDSFAGRLRNQIRTTWLWKIDT